MLSDLFLMATALKVSGHSLGSGYPQHRQRTVLRAAPAFSRTALPLSCLYLVLDLPVTQRPTANFQAQV